MSEQLVKMVNTELPDILELKDVRQVYKNRDGSDSVVIDGLNLLIEDLPGKGEFVVILGSSGCGKCVAKGTWIVSSCGLRRIEDLFEDNEISPNTVTKLSKNNKFNVIVNNEVEKISHKYYGGIKNTIKIKLKNGITIEGTENHPVLVLEKGKEEWKNLENITENDVLVQEIFQQELMSTGHRVSLPRAIKKSYFTRLNKVIKYKKMGLNNSEISKLTGLGTMQVGRYVNNKTGKIINPTFKAPSFLSNDLSYYLGLLAGDGWIGKRICLTSMDREIIEFFTQYTKTKFNTTVVASVKSKNKALSLRPINDPFYRNWIVNIFGCECNANTKDVPIVIRNGSFNNQLSFLQGLMDADGYSDHNNKRAEISLNSKNLIDFVCCMLSVLGINYTISKKKKSYRVSMKQSPGISKLFRLTRKVQPINNINLKTRNYIGVASIEASKSEVFDLTNPKSHSFIANSLVVHNSHILRYISGLQPPTSGEILINGRQRQKTDYVGMVFQQYSSFAHYTVLDNVALGLKYRGVPEKERNQKAMDIIEKVGLQDHANKFAQYPNLSGGQLQRVAIARSLAYDSRILLMDEPFGALDIETRGKMQEMIAKIWLSITPTIIMVTHAIDEAVYLGDRIYVMGGRPSNIIKEFVSPLPLERNRLMKRDTSFVHKVQEIEDFMMTM